MAKNYGKYFSNLSNKKISIKPVEPILNYMQKVMKFEEIPSILFRRGEYGSKITEELTRLKLLIVRGRKSWEGLLVSFPGNRHDLKTKNIGTPYIRMILYPILDLYDRINEFKNNKIG